MGRFYIPPRGIIDPRVVPTRPVVPTDEALELGLVALFLPGISGQNLCGRTSPISFVASPVIGGSANGPARIFNGSSQYATALPSPLLSLPATLLLQVATQSTSSQWMIDVVANASVSEALAFGIGAADTFEAGSFAGGAYAYARGTTVPVLGKLYSAAAVYASTTSRSVYVNGALEVTATTSSAPNFANINQTGIGGFYSGGTLYSPTNGIIPIASVWNTALTPGMLAQLAAEPFAMLRERAPPILYSFASGGSGTTLLLAQKSWGWSPTGPLLQFDNALAQRDWGWTGNAPGVNQETQLTLAQKPWGWVGQAPGVSRFVALAQKAWAWTAQAPVLKQSVALAQKAWNWLGQPPIIGQPTVIQLARATWGWFANAWAGASAQGGIVRGIIGGIVRGIVRR